MVKHRLRWFLMTATTKPKPMAQVRKQTKVKMSPHHLAVIVPAMLATLRLKWKKPNPKSLAKNALAGGTAPVSSKPDWTKQKKPPHPWGGFFLLADL